MPLQESGQIEQLDRPFTELVASESSDQRRREVLGSLATVEERLAMLGNKFQIRRGNRINNRNRNRARFLGSVY